MRSVKSYRAGKIPTPAEVEALSGKVIALEKANDEKSEKIAQLEKMDEAITKSLEDDVAADDLSHKIIKGAIEKVDGVIGTTIKDVETLKDHVQIAEINIGNLGKSVNSAGQRANQAFDKASQLDGSVTTIIGTMGAIQGEQENQNHRLDDLEADAKESGGNFDQLKAVGILVDDKPYPRTVILEKGESFTDANFDKTVSVDVEGLKTIVLGVGSGEIDFLGFRIFNNSKNYGLYIENDGGQFKTVTISIV